MFDKLFELLGKDLSEQFKTKLGDMLDTVKGKLSDKQLLIVGKDEKYTLDDGKMIPKHRFDEVNETNTSLKNQVTKLEGDITTIKKEAKGNDELTTKITELQNENKTVKEDMEKEQTKLKKSFALKEGLMGAGVTDSEARDLLVSKFNIDELELDDSGKVKGFDEKLKPIKENKTLAGLFGETKIAGKPPKEGVGTPDGFLSREKVKAMTQQEVDGNLEKIQESMPFWNDNESN